MNQPYTDEQLIAASQQVGRRFAKNCLPHGGKYEQVAIGIQCDLNRAVELLREERQSSIIFSCQKGVMPRCNCFSCNDARVDAFLAEQEAAR